MEIVVASVILGALGVVFGVGLAVAARKLEVKVDPKLAQVNALLPGVNCGACGAAGCMGFAEGLISGKYEVTGCRVSEEAVQRKIAELLGKTHTKKARSAAVLHCHGGTRVKSKYTYEGIADCRSANQLLGGPKACFYGCIGLGTCARACPFGAIRMDADGLPVVDERACTACGKCVSACPKRLYTLGSVSKVYAVRCRSLDMGKRVMDVCSAGCIGCRRCEKACPVGAIKVADNIAVIDYAVCDNRGACYNVCPTKAIAKKENHLWITRQ